MWHTAGSEKRVCGTCDKTWHRAEPAGPMNADTMSGGIVLARVAGFIDGLFTPVRYRREGNAAWVNAWRARREFIAGGGAAVPLGGGDAAQRQAQSRAIGDLVKSKALRQVARRRLVLTPVGDAMARRALGMPSAADALDLLAELRTWPAGAWVCQTTLADAPTGKYPAYQAAIASLHERGAVALAAGWIETRATVPGSIGWRATDAGAALNIEAARSAAVKATHRAAEADPVDIDEATDAWTAGYRDARHWMESAESTGDIGPIPLTAEELHCDRPEPQAKPTQPRAIRTPRKPSHDQ